MVSQSSVVMSASVPQQVGLVHVGVATVRKMATMMARPTTTSQAATTMVKKRHALARRGSPCMRAKVTKAQVAGVEHQFDAHEHDDGIAPQQHPGGADGEQQRR